MSYNYYKRQRLANRCIRILTSAKAIYDELLDNSPVGCYSFNYRIDDFLVDNFDVYHAPEARGHGL